MLMCKPTESEGSVFQFPSYLLSVFLFTPRVRVNIHQPDNVSLCVRMKEPARQIERKRKRQIEGRERGREREKEKKTTT